MVRASLTFGSATADTADSSSLTFANANQLTAIGASAFKGTAFTSIDLSTSTSLQTIGPDAFSAIIGLQTVKMSPEQAQVVNPGVFSGVSENGGAQNWTINVGNTQNSYTAPSSLGPTLTPSSNLNKFTGVQTINLAATSVTTLAGPVLFGNDKIEKLVLPATATNWQLTEPNSYESAPIGNVGSGQGIEFTNFGQSTNTAASDFNSINWALVASIMNMFGRVEADKGKDTNLAIWSEGFKDRELTATTVKSGWTKGSGAKQGEETLSESTSGTFTKTVNGVEWKYEKASSGAGISISVDTSQQTKLPNLYKAGYTGNANAFFQVGFGEENGKIKTDTQVSVTLKLVGA